MGRRVTDPRDRTLSRHLRWETLDSRIRAGPPSVEPIEGSPRVHIFIEPQGARIGARFYVSCASLPASPLAEVAIRIVGIGTASAVEISTGNAELYRDFYTLCCSIADRVQEDRQDLSTAISQTLGAWSMILRRQNLLSVERQIGLIGELLFLKRAARALGWKVAAGSWYGPDLEEHDFVLPVCDVEVKATVRERRIHQVSSLTQLQPKTGRKLYLVSTLLTPAGAAEVAYSLPDLVADALSGATESAVQAADRIRDQLKRLGWKDSDAEHYGGRYCLRGPVMAIEVNAAFPAVTPALLAGMGAAAGRVQDVGYSINVDGMGRSIDRDGIKHSALFGRGAGHDHRS